MTRSPRRFSLLRNMKLGTQLSLTISFVVAIPLIILLIFFTNPLYDMVIASTIRDEQNVSSQIAPLLEEQVSEIVDTMGIITDQAYFKDMFQTPLDKSPEEMADLPEAYDFMHVIASLNDKDSCSAVRIYVNMPSDDPFFNKPSAKDIFLPESDAASTYWNGIMHSTNYPALFCPEFYLTKSASESFGNCAYILRTSMYYDGNVYPAYAALYYNNSIYANVLKDAIAIDGSVSYIINDRDALVYTTDEALSGTYRLKYEDIKASLMSSNSFVERTIADVAVYVAFYYIPQADWFMVNVIPKDPVYHIANIWMNKFCIICIACLMLAMVIAILVSHSATGRIAAISRQMALVHNAPPVAMPEPYLNDEVGELVKTYNYMTGEMNKLIKKQEETAEELRFAEFNALQAQINPHFLYNTMDMINWMALQGRNKEVSEVVQNLSKFYKLTLSRKKDYSTIADELEHAQVYIELQNMRFNDAIDFVIDVPDELTECRLPKLTFQPILENAILHGILEKEEKTGTIVLTAWEEGEDIRILISDDGAGMEEDIRKNILSEKRIKPTSSRGANVAIVNIHRRLQLLYGSRYGLSYESSPGKGCEVTILIPKHLGDAPYTKQTD